MSRLRNLQRPAGRVSCQVSRTRCRRIMGKGSTRPHWASAWGARSRALGLAHSTCVSVSKYPKLSEQPLPWLRRYRALERAASGLRGARDPTPPPRGLWLCPQQSSAHLSPCGTRRMGKLVCKRSQRSPRGRADGPNDTRAQQPPPTEHSPECSRRLHRLKPPPTTADSKSLSPSSGSRGAPDACSSSKK